MNNQPSSQEAQQTANGASADFDAQSRFHFQNQYQHLPPNAKNMDEEADAAKLSIPMNSLEAAAPSFSNKDSRRQSPQSGHFEHMLDSAPGWPSNPFGPGGFDSMHLPNGQSQIVRDRPGSVQQNFGQITPPDDMLSDTSSNRKRKSPVDNTDLEKAKSEKSERARNAANHRHAKTKQQRRDSRQGMASPDSDGEEGEDKKEKYREKNRVAAAKCRAKKKTNIETIEERHRDLNAMNSVLKKQVQELRGELTGLRTHALNHQDCRCQIARYNMNQARKMTFGGDDRGMPNGYGSFGSMPSPDMSCSRNHSMMSVPTMQNAVGFNANQSFGGPSNYGFPSGEETGDLSSGRDQFDEFMQSNFEEMDFSQS